MVGDGLDQESMVERAFAEAIATQGVVTGTSDFARDMAQISRGRGRSAADVFDSLSSDRPYRPALTLDEARRMIVLGSGSQFDPSVVSAFNSIHDQTFLRITEEIR